MDNNKTPTMIKAIVGLGNPGPQYVFTRHNIGFQIVDALAEKYNAVWQKKDQMLTATVQINGHVVQLIKPQTFMNNSGTIIPSLIKKGIKPEMILVVHDELEKPFGILSFKEQGSHKGHNGLRSIIAACGDAFWRLRCGIGRPDSREQVPQYVLQTFKEPYSEVQKFINNALIALEALFV